MRLALLLAVLAATGCGTVTCELNGLGGCDPGCGAPFRGREVVETAQCLAGEVALFCTTQSGFNEAMGCLASPEEELFWTSSLVTELPDGWRACTSEEANDVQTMAACTR